MRLLYGQYPIAASIPDSRPKGWHVQVFTERNAGWMYNTLIDSPDSGNLRRATILFQKGQGPPMFNTHPQLRYLGMIPQPNHSEYGFRIENEDKTIRLLILTVANSVFLTKQLMVQEAPDLCYQKVLTDLKSETPGTVQDFISVSESDIAHYRACHPNVKLQRKSSRKPSL
jgi:hypothetical protein